MSSKVPEVALNNGQAMPQLGLGTWQAKPGEVEKAVATAIDIGYRHIDGAALYLNEKEVGKAIREKIEAGVVKREELFVVSKLWGNKHHPDDVESACVKTLSDLGLDYLDLYLIHSPVALRRGDDMFPKDEQGKVLYEANVSLEQTWAAMEKLVSKGLVRSIGISNFNSKQVQRIVNSCSIRPVTNQVEVNPLVHQEPLFQFCKKLDITITAYTPIGSGQVIAKDAKGKDVPKVLEQPALVALASKYKRSVAQLILRWLIQRGIIVIPKSIRSERLKENFDVFDFEISDEDMKVFFTIGEANRKPVRWGAIEHPEYPFSEDPDFF